MRIRTIAFLTFGLLIASAAIVTLRPHSITEAGLGSDWQCSRNMIITSCKRS